MRGRPRARRCGASACALAVVAVVAWAGSPQADPNVFSQFSDFAEVCPTLQGRAEPEPTPELVERGRLLFESTTAFEQEPSEGAMTPGERLSCKSCHAGVASEDGRNHLVPTERRRLALRQAPHLLRIEDTPVRRDERQDAGGFGWDGRFPCSQAVAASAILAPTEMNAARAPEQDELDALAAFVRTFDVPDAQPGVDFDPELAALGEQVFQDTRPVVDQGGEFAAGEEASCATCHSGPNLTDRKFHRILLPRGDPVVDPGRVDDDGSEGDDGLTPPALSFGDDPQEQTPGVARGQITSFKTPALRGLRLTAPYFHEGLAGDPSGAGHNTGDPDRDRAAARAALAATVAFYDERFAFRFTPREQAALVEFLMSR